MRPVPRGYYTMRDLRDGSVTILDARIANDHIEVVAENIRRMQSR
jgi:hypothetical protein